MPKFLAPVDLTFNALNNATVQNLSGAPTLPTAVGPGGIYFDTTSNRLKLNIGTAGSPNWTLLSTATDSGAAFNTISDGTNTGSSTSSQTITFASGNSALTAVVSSDTITYTLAPANITHSTLGGLTTGDAGHTQFALLAGRSGGQILQGGTASSDNLTLKATSNATNSGSVVINTAVSISTSAVTVTDGVNYVLGSTNGTQFGTATTQKIGFFGSSAIVQPSNTTDLRQALINLGLYASGGATPLNLNGGTLYTPSISATTSTTAGTGITIAGGGTTGTSATSGLVNILGGTASGTGSFGGNVNIAGGASSGTTTATGGSVQLQGGTGTSTAGSVYIKNSNGTSTWFQSNDTGIGFFGATPVAKQAATTDLITALANYGLFTGGGPTPLNLNGGTLTAGTVNATTFNGAFSGTFAAGSQSAPSITFTSNTAVGLYSPATNAIAIVSNNSERVRYNATGVGWFGATPVAQQSGDIRSALINYGLMSSANALTFLAGATVTVDNLTAVNSTLGSALAITGGSSSQAGSAGGSVSLVGGAQTGGGGASGGSVTIKGGTASAGAGGTVILASAGGTTRLNINDTGLAFFTANPISQPSGDIRTALVNLGLMSSASSLVFAAGGSVTSDTLQSVSGTTGSNLSVFAGSSSGSSTAGGSIAITAGAGNGTTSNGGSVTIKPGATTGGTAGSVLVQNSGGTTQFQVNGTGIGFFGVTPVARQSGDIGTALINLGLMSSVSGLTSSNLTVTNLTIASSGSVTISDGDNITLGTSSGTQIGTASNQKIGFLGATPIAQQAQTVDLKQLLVNFGFYSSTAGNTPLNLGTGGAFVAGTGSFNGAVAMNSNKITGLADPTNPQDAATKNYVDATANGLQFKDSVNCASTANVSGTYAASGGTSTHGQFTAMSNAAIDGVTLAAGSRILLKNQSTATQNGIWVVTTLGTGSNGVWDRTTDFDGVDDNNNNNSTEVQSGAFIFVQSGTSFGDTGWVLSTTGTITVGTTSLAFTQFSGAGTYTAGNGLLLTGTSFSVVTNSTYGTTITSNAVALSGQALAFHQLSGTGMISLTAANTPIVRTITGTSNRTSVTFGDGVSGNPTIDISGSYVGQTSITTLGTIGTGTWQGTAVGVGYGGTGATTAAGAKTNLGFLTRYAATITGDGTTTSFTVTHNLGTQDVEILVQDPANNYETVYPNSRSTSTTQAAIVFGLAPANSVTYRVVIVG